MIDEIFKSMGVEANQNNNEGGFEDGFGGEIDDEIGEFIDEDIGDF